MDSLKKEKEVDNLKLFSGRCPHGVMVCRIVVNEFVL